MRLLIGCDCVTASLSSHLQAQASLDLGIAFREFGEDRGKTLRAKRRQVVQGDRLPRRYAFTVPRALRTACLQFGFSGRNFGMASVGRDWRKSRSTEKPSENALSSEPICSRLVHTLLNEKKNKILGEEGVAFGGSGALPGSSISEEDACVNDPLFLLFCCHGYD